MRASTPTHAAKIISESWERGALELDQHVELLSSNIREHMTQANYFIDSTLGQAQASLERRFAELDQALAEHSKKLTLGNPELKLKQGYVVASNLHGTVKSIDHINVGDMINIRFYDGSAKSEILSTKSKTNRLDF